MTKNILAAAALVGALSSGAFAYDQNKDEANSQDMRQQNNQKTFTKQQKSMHCDMKQHKKRSMHKRDSMRMFLKANLTDKQRYQISILQDEMRLSMKKARGYTKKGKMSNFISANGFDKTAFIKDADERHTKMTELRAEFLEKAFSVLSQGQRELLKTKLSK